MNDAAATGQQGGLLSGRYRLRAQLGAGGMGEVWAAEQLATGLTVAVKLLRPDAATDRELIARFELEARTLCRVRHPHVLHLIDFGFDPERGWFLVTELLEGETLGTLLSRRGALPPQDAARIGSQILAGLAAAHEAGVVHRDLKPDNVMLLDAAGVRLLDFGIAKLLDGHRVDLTHAGQVFGTPAYISPEQALGKPVDHRADLYAVGVILYRMVAGRLPFDGDSATALAMQHASEPPPPLPAGVPPPLARLVERALAKDPAARFESAAAMGAALRELAAALEAGSGPIPLTRVVDTRPPEARLTPPRGLQRTGGMPALSSPGAGAVPRSDGICSRALLAVRFAWRGAPLADVEPPHVAAREVVGHFHGRIVWSGADGLLAEFASPTDTLQCAAAVSDQVAAHGQPVDLKSAVTAGDVLRSGRFLYGEAVQQAELLAQAATPGEVLFTQGVYLAMTRSEVSFEPYTGRDPGASQKLYLLRRPALAPRPELPFGGATLVRSRILTLRKVRRAVRASPGVLGKVHPLLARAAEGLLGAVRGSPVVAGVGAALALALAIVAAMLPWGHAARVEERIEQGAQESARELVDRWLAESPDDPVAQAYRGWVLAHDDELDEAHAALEHALARKPDLAKHAGVAEALVRVLDRKGADTSLVLRNRTKQLEKALIAGTTSTHYWERWNSVRTLERMGLSEWIDWVEVYLLDVQFAGSCGTRVRAARKLGELGDPRAIPTLEEQQRVPPSGAACNLERTIEAALRTLRTKEQGA